MRDELYIITHRNTFVEMICRSITQARHSFDVQCKKYVDNVLG